MHPGGRNHPYGTEKQDRDADKFKFVSFKNLKRGRIVYDSLGIYMRRKDREVTNITEILQVVEKAKVLHLALFDADYPYIIPLHYGYEYTDGNLIFYMHSAKEGHKLDLIRSNPNVCIELESDVELISGGDIACKYGASFASVIGRGRAELVSDSQEKIRGLSLLMKNQTGREFIINEEMASTVEIIKAVISEFTAKLRPKA